jgi:hypothetical protein
MFEELFRKAAFVVVHKIAPYAVERQQFLEHCREQGFTKTCLQRMAVAAWAPELALLYRPRVTRRRYKPRLRPSTTRTHWSRIVRYRGARAATGAVWIESV